MSVTLYPFRARCAALSSGLIDVPVIQGSAAVVKIAMLREGARRSDSRVGRRTEARVSSLETRRPRGSTTVATWREGG